MRLCGEDTTTQLDKVSTLSFYVPGSLETGLYIVPVHNLIIGTDTQFLVYRGVVSSIIQEGSHIVADTKHGIYIGERLKLHLSKKRHVQYRLLHDGQAQQGYLTRIAGRIHILKILHAVKKETAVLFVGKQRLQVSHHIVGTKGEI